MIYKGLRKYNFYRLLEAAGTNEVVYAGQDDGTELNGMMDEKHEEGSGRQRAKGRSQQQQPCN